MLTDRSYRHKQLGIISLIGAAPAAGPAAPLVIAAALVGTFVPILLHMIGRGRKEADYLTKPNEGAQWIIEHQTLPALIDPYTAIKQSGQPFSLSYLENLIAGLEHVRDVFVDYAGKLTHAGPGAIATITHIINDILIPDIKAQFGNTTKPAEPTQPETQKIPESAATVPLLVPHPVIRVVSAGIESDWTWLLIAGLLIVRSQTKGR